MLLFKIITKVLVYLVHHFPIHKTKTIANTPNKLNLLSVCCPQIETSQLICTANQLTGFYMRAKLALNGSNK